MATQLVVTHPFGEYAIGDRITDAETIAKVTESHPSHVVRTVADDTPPAAPAST